MKDVQLNPKAESTYECFSCGTVVRATAPERCPKCGTDMRNRQTPIE
ncbi:rubrerythrin-like domain-containing protein [Natronorubrum sp. A-ect3]